MFVETLEEPQHSAWPSPESESPEQRNGSMFHCPVSIRHDNRCLEDCCVLIGDNVRKLLSASRMSNMVA
jgi:hypothetical protein